MTDITPTAASTDEAADTNTEPQVQGAPWTGVLWLIPDQVQQILDANDLADATEE